MAFYSLEKRQEYLQKEDAVKETLPPFSGNPRLNDPSLYQPSEALVDAVNVALRLGLPLLLTGEPGSGKTQLADHLAWYFNLGEPLRFQARTTSTATDLFYRYDALGHFQYSQNSREPLSLEDMEKDYINFEALGKAIKDNKRCLVLIDEIDKAPRDLPNDVLDNIDKLRFKVPELKGKEFVCNPENRPFILMTSNKEKNLPDAFLRRVVYFHIDFPEPEKMLEIVAAKVQGLDAEALKPVVDHFYSLRQARDLRLNKAPATAELIQWASYLQELHFPVAKLKNTDQLNEQEQQQLKGSYSIVAKTRDDLEALYKRLDD
jgi:MoxR-like ATPase